MRPRGSGYVFVAPYVVLLVAVGIYPVGYATNLALTSFTAHFTGLTNFVDSFDNPEFLAGARKRRDVPRDLAHGACRRWSSACR